MGDIAAQLAGCLLGRDLTKRARRRYGVPTFERAVEIILDQSEAAARAQIRAMPDGIYRAESFLDDDGSSDKPLPIKVKVDRRRRRNDGRLFGHCRAGQGTDQFRLLRRRPDDARVAFKYLMGADEPANEGTFRPLKLILPAGKLLSAAPTAPMGNYSTPFPTVIDTIIKALEKALPERVTGGHFGTFRRRSSGGARTARFFDCIDSGHGGWGACATHDGAGPFRTMAHGDTRIIPIELQEMALPFRIEEFSLREDSAGAGKFRGGLGFRKRYRMLALQLQTNLDRTKFPPWGVQGGKEAKPGRFTVVNRGPARTK